MFYVREVRNLLRASNFRTPARPARFENFRLWSIGGSGRLLRHVLSTPDRVAKVENRTTPKISQKLIFSRLRRGNTPYRRYDAPWSILCETVWSLISPRAKRISGSKNFRSSPQKAFFNTIPPEADASGRVGMSAG